MKKILSLSLAVLMLLSLACTGFTFSAGASSSISYSFSGNNKDDAGYAQGTITLSVDDTAATSTYYLYWADDNEALEGYAEIAKVTATSGKATFDMPAQTAIPADATKLIAIKSASKPTNKSVSSAQAVYSITNSKLPTKDSSQKLYTFEALSDIHMCEGGSSSYPYDEQHLASAFKTAADREVDFIVTSGDHVNNQRVDSGGTSSNPYYPAEWDRYLKILSESNYCNPIYEAIGNHELWNGDTESNYHKDWTQGYNYFIKRTGLDSNEETINSGKAYYEITEPNTGDHFIFLALEGGFYPDRVEEFSDEQLAWLESKLSEYDGDGRNCFIVEHCNFYKWGAGDQPEKPIYDIPLKDTSASTVKLKEILKTYKNAVVITGHTHFQFEQQLNYSTNSDTSSIIMHNSSVGAVRMIKNGTTRVNDASLERTEGYIVDVYSDHTVFNGTNLYYDEIIPTASYYLNIKTNEPEPTEPTTQDPTTQAPTTQAPTTVAPTTVSPTTTVPTTTVAPTTLMPVLYGDVDLNNIIDIVDATYIQKTLAKSYTLSGEQMVRAKVDGTDILNIVDATLIQKKLAQLIDKFPVEENLAKTSATAPTITKPAEELADTAAGDVSALLKQARIDLTANYLYASYDQYQALKKYVKELEETGDTRQAAYDKLNELYTEFNKLVGEQVKTSRIYFTNGNNWSSVRLYWWGSKSENPTWDASPVCTFVKKNDYGQDVYCYDVPADAEGIIWRSNSGSAKSQDIKGPFSDNQAWYPKAKMGGSDIPSDPTVWEVGTWTFS